MKKIKISIITATFNSAATIARALESVKRQTYEQVEHIIVDGGSTDDTKEIVERIGTNGRTIFMPGPDNGIYEAFNKGLRVATGEWICFLGSDDQFSHDRAIEDILPYLERAGDEEKKYVYPMVQYVRSDGSEIEVTGINWEKASKSFHKAMNINHCGSFTHNSAFASHGFFNETFKIAGDYEFLLRIFKNGSQPLFVPLVLVKMQTGGISNRLNNRSVMAREVRLAQKINGYNPLNTRMIYWQVKIWVAMFLGYIFGTRTLYKLADLYRQSTGQRKRWA